MALRRASSSHDRGVWAEPPSDLTESADILEHRAKLSQAWGQCISSRHGARTTDEACIIPQQPTQLLAPPPAKKWQGAVADTLAQAHEQWHEHFAKKTSNTPLSVHKAPAHGPVPPPEVLGSRELYTQWRSRVSPLNCCALAMHPTRFSTTLKGRPVCVWILSHLNAPIVEWDSYFAHVFAPLTPRVVYGVTSGEVDQSTEDMVSHVCVMQAWRGSAFAPPLWSGEGMPSPWLFVMHAAY